MRDFVIVLLFIWLFLHYVNYEREQENKKQQKLDYAGNSIKREKTDRASERIRFLNALWAVESSKRLRPPDGDNGNSIGPYQISLPYFLDSRCDDFCYDDCRIKERAEIIIEKYMLRYCPEAWIFGDWETVARIHNGGPRGAFKHSTRKYWEKVKSEMGVADGYQSRDSE